ncbi:MAG: hypothetical protein KME10_17980 [Plectolyngbya sp. WJT66-NPBG17]|nr:hypothetical protein [Plectolyngbya sp. WJT66-NPBG17]
MTVKLTGKVFTGSPRRAFLNAANRTKDRALRVTRDRSRVRTGKMRAGWRTEITNGTHSLSLAISNQVPYTVYQERGTKYISPMLAAAAGLQTATTLFQQELQNELQSELGGAIRSRASSGRGFGRMTR